MKAVTAADFDWGDYGAALFDLDGVITPTADIHEQAWAELLGPFGYDIADYHDYIDGRPRYDGVREFLRAHSITLPEGTPDDPPGDSTVCALGNRKNVLFNDILSSHGIAAYPGSLATLDLLAAIGTPAAVVSSSRNARRVLEAAGLVERFDVIVDGVVVADEGLRGKPAPDSFAFAAARLCVTNDHAVVIEDAPSGVAAGRAGGFEVVVGVDRGAGAVDLLDHGATFVVADLADLLPSSRPHDSVPR